MKGERQFNLSLDFIEDGLDQCCPTFLCTRAQFTDAYGGAGPTTLLLLLINTTISTTS
jgi:hypothetical protein